MKKKHTMNANIKNLLRNVKNKYFNLKCAVLNLQGCKERVLGNEDGTPLFEGNEHILNIYNNQAGGKKRRNKRNTRKRNTRKRNTRKKNTRKRNTRKKKKRKYKY